MTSEARTRPPDEEEASAVSSASAADTEPEDGSTVAGTPRDPDGAVQGRTRDRRSRLSLPLVPTLAVLLVLLLAAAAFLWFTRPEPSEIRTGDYGSALQAARSGVVDLTSFDHLTLDDDIEQARRVTTGDLREESVAQLEERRADILALEAVVNTEVVGAGVIRADGEDATVMLLIQSTQQSTGSPQPQIVRYRIEVTLQKEGERWLLSGITGTETGVPTDE
ncbi:hypothetical protein [Blastococcus sp. PRF04-17]|uniref:hypothetical protein n=1 Tax=Blastococcus sp. PRF04-17 TaxID=2933797 RepID=UPI001FF69CEF|nr:hypothetical protein [Blastococcus sp. PRF04-17]UOY01041.1 hypothetical protein MVA48_19045 [Blastococcus sp. PRF04-17]